MSVVRARLCDILLRPVVTEKSNSVSAFSKYTFKVLPDASKREVKHAVEGLFGVSVSKVNVLNRKGKSKVFKGVKGRRKLSKTAVVTLKSGQVIEDLS